METSDEAPDTHGGQDMVEIQETALPGVGLRHDFTTREGRRIGVISHRTGRREVFVCPADDPEGPSEVVELTEAESSALADLLGGSKVVEDVSRQQQIEGLAIDWVALPPDSPYGGSTIGDTQARTRTGVSVVAVLRGGTTVPAPDPSEILRAGDVLVVVGTAAGIRRLVELLQTG